MTGNELRKSFVDFFKSKEHKHFESASLIPDDKSLLLTVAGMVPFKPFFLGEKEAPFKRITTYQKCIRTNDLENVGKTPRHHTFFEMLGNFSFGDYFKKEAIEWSWEYITKVLKLDKERLWVSVFETDDEAYKIWNEEIGVPAERMVRLGEDDNWWAAGPVGSCGPCSEIYYDTQNMGKNNEEINCKPGDEGDRFLEIWNLVFTEWNRLEDGTLVPLPEKNIDTGAGIERIASVIQNKKSNFETDLFMPIIKGIEKVLDIKKEEHDEAVKVIADHIRASVFLIGDGVLPSNEGRGYILRKIIRRAFGVGSVAKEKVFEKEDIFLHKLVSYVVETMKDGYPDLVEKSEYIEKVIKIEEERFSTTLKNGTEMLSEEIAKLKKQNKKKLSSEISFKLYDTFGFPFELTKLILNNEGIEVSEEDFEKRLEEQITRSQRSRVTISDMIKDDFIDEFFEKHGKTEFTGYENFADKGKILYAAKSEGMSGYEMIFDKTPFYAESGGQVSDTGKITAGEFEGRVVDVVKKRDVFIHQVEVIKGIIPAENTTVELEIDVERRKDIQRNHTATHILHKVLREKLGTHVEQSGSLVESDRLRFDFSHYEPISKEMIEEIEYEVNNVILSNIKTKIDYENIQEAKNRGAMALFSDKYGDIVRVVEIPGFSIELCGGAHVKSTGEIGFFNIESETGISSGVRRIIATTGHKSLEYVNGIEEKLAEISATMKSDENNIVEVLKKYKNEFKDLEKAYMQLQSRLLKYEINEIFEGVEEISGVKVLAKTFENKNIDELKEIVDRGKEKLQSGIIILGSNNEKAIFVAGVTKDLISKIKAGDIVKVAAQTADGNGGGRPDFAQAGGKNGSAVKEAVEKSKEYIVSQLS
ncbi:alanine--tRNA ligase [Pseudoleptotrichia goodfellowii]|uniref:Alanine--tRNA ligase n=1 Tax=Pseudoleptotrichia goodfellowii F0264 TaxID=596323 RepID=D0GKX1_9FUSO|nr:alanine--tRNA ligase [Pseudoleptotrichia goodfellowii]EEY35260.1 alanine--tRNA ligase [Pseudoleptotrichia goodfellowii F0264]